MTEHDDTESKTDTLSLVELADMVSGPVFQLGICSGWEQAANLCQQRSGEAFAQRFDDEARFWRQAEEAMRKVYASARQAYDETEQQRSRLAYAELGKRDGCISEDA